MYKFLKTTLIVLLIIFTVFAYAKSDEDIINVPIIGYGHHTCGSWVANEKTDQLEANYQHAWLNGAMTMANFFTMTDNHEKPLNFLRRGLDRPALALWVTNYCQSHPFENVLQAALSLRAELINQATHPRPSGVNLRSLTHIDKTISAAYRLLGYLSRSSFRSREGLPFLDHVRAASRAPAPLF